MFGMKKESSGEPVDAFKFDLEVDLEDPGALRAKKEEVEMRVLQLKKLLREGGDKETFENAQTLLHAYLAVQKVLERINRKSI